MLFIARYFQVILISICSSTTFSAKWVKISKPNMIWEEMEVSNNGERMFYCGEFDGRYTGKYHWRFNGSSILPQRTQIHRNQFVFLSTANAIRNQLSGEYECCVRETLGNACYSRLIQVKNRSSIHNIDLSLLNELKAQEGDTYYLRLQNFKRIDAIKCTLDGDPTELFKYPILEKNTKKAVPYHLKIENLDREGSVNCDIRIHKKEVIQKQFYISFNANSTTIFSPFFLLFSLFSLFFNFC